MTSGTWRFEIERIDLGLAGGRQDQYAATFGGFNFMEFYADDRVIVNPLRIKNWIMSDLESSIILFFTGKSRSSAAIIKEQSSNITSGSDKSLEATHQLKRDAYAMKEAVLKGNIGDFTDILNRSWIAKRQTAGSVFNPMIEGIFDITTKTGVLGGKVSGAGGGGFIMFVVEPEQRAKVLAALGGCDGLAMPCHFTPRGMEGWRIL
jgi:D-glycero-alpha-D-manno-heptose-7-phosphate kinase